jgi:hypothetical protein
MPIILATWKAEIWRILFQTKPCQKVRQTTFQPMAGSQWLMPVISATWEADIRKIIGPSQHRQRSLQSPISKENNLYSLRCA